MTWEQKLNNIIKWQCSQGRKFVTNQLEFWCSNEEHIFKSIKDYIILDFKKISKQNEFLVVRNDYKVFKSFENTYNAIDYCLDKINTENKQISFDL